MGFRFWRRLKVAPGVYVNFSKSGASLSLGPRGARYTIGPRGQRATVGLPGTGLFYTTTLSRDRARRVRRSRASASSAPAPVVVPLAARLKLSFFDRLFTPKAEENLVDGCRAFLEGNETKAIELLSQALHLPDAAYLAGFLALKHERYDEAIEWLRCAASDTGRLGRWFARYGVSLTLSVPITDEVCAHFGVSVRGALLGLVEAYQRAGQPQAALECLDRMRRFDPEDVLVRLSMAELLWDTFPDDRRVCHRIVRLAEGVPNASEIHAALWLYKARALRSLGVLDAARSVLSQALRRRSGRSEELLRALRYERALVYEALGETSRARREFEALYAEAPDYEDVAQRVLGPSSSA